ncbi:hypothetical protein EV360DRAFT_58666, partial [Lentinula raphanica]
VLHAREELVHFTIEIWYLHTFIIDEEKQFTQVLKCLVDTLTYYPVNKFIRQRHAVNQLLLSYLHQTQVLPGFTGHQNPS